MKSYIGPAGFGPLAFGYNQQSHNSFTMKHKIILASFGAIIICAAGLIWIGIFPNTTPSPENVSAPSPKQPESNSITAPQATTPTAQSAQTPEPDPTDPVLDALYDSQDMSVKLTAARRLAARGDEASFRAIASVLVAAEFTGDATNEQFVKDLAQVLRQMRGPQIGGVAKEMAYGPSVLLSEVAVDVAVAGEPIQESRQIGDDPTMQGRPLPGNDADAQGLLNAELSGVTNPAANPTR